MPSDSTVLEKKYSLLVFLVNIFAHAECAPRLSSRHSAKLTSHLSVTNYQRLLMSAAPRETLNLLRGTSSRACLIHFVMPYHFTSAIRVSKSLLTSDGCLQILNIKLLFQLKFFTSVVENFADTFNTTASHPCNLSVHL